MAVTVFLSCELDTLCELWHFDLYRLDLLSNHVAVIAVVQCFDHEGLQVWHVDRSMSLCDITLRVPHDRLRRLLYSHFQS